MHLAPISTYLVPSTSIYVLYTTVPGQSISISMTTSFKKRGTTKSIHPRGTRPSLHNAQLLVSTGVPSLDMLLGGGLPVGSVLLIEEDTCGSYSRLLLKYFLSEGVMCGHALFLASASESPDTILKDIPGCTEVETQSQLPAIREDSPPTTGGEEQMKIAWRYQNKPQVQSSFSTQFGHYFDLTTHMDSARLKAVSTTCFNAMDMTATSAFELYNTLRDSIESSMDTGSFSIDESPSTQGSVLRIALQSLGSPLWLDEGGMAESTPSLPRFLHSLRGLLRRAQAVALVTVPTHLMQDSAHVSRLERLSDAVIHLESFAGSDKEQNPLYRDYHGLCHLCKIPCLNSLVSHFPETLDLAFKLKKRKFQIEKLHLPPELSDTASRTQEESIRATGAEASHLMRKKVDF